MVSYGQNARNGECPVLTDQLLTSIRSDPIHVLGNLSLALLSIETMLNIRVHENTVVKAR